MGSLEKFEQFVSRYRYVPGETREGERKEVVYKRWSRGVSLGERLVHDILERNCGLRYKHDFVTEFVTEQGGRRLRFDFFIPGDRLMVEFDGDQHYTGSKFYHTRGEWMDAVQRDEIKNGYCRTEKLSLLRIPSSYSRHPSKLRTLLVDFIHRVRNTDGPVIEVDLYFKLKSGYVTL